MKKVETKYYCDFCHEECTDDHHKLTIPTIERLAINSSGQSILGSTDVDICHKCTETVALALAVISTYTQDATEYNGSITLEATKNKNHLLDIIDHVKVTIDCDYTNKN